MWVGGYVLRCSQFLFHRHRTRASLCRQQDTCLPLVHRLDYVIVVGHRIWCRLRERLFLRGFIDEQASSDCKPDGSLGEPLRSQQKGHLGHFVD